MKSGLLWQRGAEFRDVGARGLALEALGLVHGDVGIVAGAVAAVAIGATQPVGDVDVVLDEGGGTFGGVIDGGVAGHAGIRGGGAAWDIHAVNHRRKRMAGALI